MSSTDIEQVARAIWAQEWEEPFPPEGTATYAMAMSMARAAMGESTALIERLRARETELAEALKGVIAEADRETVAFQNARRLINGED